MLLPYHKGERYRNKRKRNQKIEENIKRREMEDRKSTQSYDSYITFN